MTLLEVYALFPTKLDCLHFVCRVRWPMGIVCVYCQHPGAHVVLRTQRVHCPHCYSDFSPFMGTVLYRSKLPLQKWFWFLVRWYSGAPMSIRQWARLMSVNKVTVSRMMEALKACSAKEMQLIERLICQLKNQQGLAMNHH